MSKQSRFYPAGDIDPKYHRIPDSFILSKIRYFCKALFIQQNETLILPTNSIKTVVVHYSSRLYLELQGLKTPDESLFKRVPFEIKGGDLTRLVKYAIGPDFHDYELDNEGTGADPDQYSEFSKCFNYEHIDWDGICSACHQEIRKLKDQKFTNYISNIIDSRITKQNGKFLDGVEYSDLLDVLDDPKLFREALNDSMATFKGNNKKDPHFYTYVETRDENELANADTVKSKVEQFRVMVPFETPYERDHTGKVILDENGEPKVNWALKVELVKITQIVDVTVRIGCTHIPNPKFDKVIEQLRTQIASKVDLSNKLVDEFRDLHSKKTDFKSLYNEINLFLNSKGMKVFNIKLFAELCTGTEETEKVADSWEDLDFEDLSIGASKDKSVEGQAAEEQAAEDENQEAAYEQAENNQAAEEQSPENYSSIQLRDENGIKPQVKRKVFLRPKGKLSAKCLEKKFNLNYNPRAVGSNGRLAPKSVIR